MGVEAGEQRQDRGVDVEHPPAPVGDEARRQHPHEAGEAEDLGAAVARAARRAPPRRRRGRRGTARWSTQATGSPSAAARARPPRLGPVGEDEAGLGRMRRGRPCRARARACSTRRPRSGSRRAAALTDAPRSGRPRPRRHRPIRSTVSPASAKTAASAAARSGATTATMPMPQLKVLSISASADPGGRASQAKTGGSVQASRSTSAPRPVGQHPRQVLGQPAAGDVGEAVHARRPAAPRAPGARRSASASSSAAPSSPAPKGRGRRPRRAPSASTTRRTRLKPFECTPLEARPSSTSPAATPRGSARAALHRADREAREVEVAAGVHPRHLGGLAADQRRAGLGAAARRCPRSPRPPRRRRACPVAK